ncbi:tRNA pseudouridine55 synthase [Plasmodium inui San Antonio 1]|uniref:tRNA pseudouridine(55) synthase n=1 Tax=Plasmodium inui San Antonio 1 TaxID=1237626 RepID=W7A734_9APIC|nr:tRNA pseudouridine55 synthase [Plasmodium inui San Antonio 1]EUD64934.1 tRNA pseudouridine55 synthase [Plasmodium inui San Antonio 1]
MPRAPLALRLCVLCALLPLLVHPRGRNPHTHEVSLLKALHRRGNQPISKLRAAPSQRIHPLPEPPPSLQTFDHPHNGGNRTKLFYLCAALKKLGRLRIVLRGRSNSAGVSKNGGEMKDGVDPSPRIPPPKRGVQMGQQEDALGEPPNKPNRTAKIAPRESETNKGETRPLESETPRGGQPNSVDFYISLYKDHLLKRHSKIMELSPPRQSEQTERKRKKEATLDDILYGGLLNIYKPVNMYSMKVCQRVKQVLREHFKHVSQTNLNFKVGHGGTLDPFAEGVLVIGIQKGTKQLIDFLKCYKKYLALGLFGLETDTLDREGTVVKTSSQFVKGTSHLGTTTHDERASQENITLALSKFIGHIDQTPPLYSAKRVDGMRLYEYARRKIAVHIKPNKVHIQDLKYLNQVDLPFFDLEIKCSGGTYIRSLVRDFAHALNTHATLIKLIRIQQGGNFLYEHSLHYDDINMENVKRHLIKL